MKEETKALVQAALVQADAAAQQWLRDTASKVDEVVRGMLNARLERMIANYMGFRDSYAGWEIDYSNGRSGESEAGLFLRKKAAENARAWLEEQAGNLPALPKSAIAALRREYLEAIEAEVARLLKKKAIADAQKAVDQILEIKNG